MAVAISMSVYTEREGILSFQLLLQPTLICAEKSPLTSILSPNQYLVCSSADSGAPELRYSCMGILQKLDRNVVCPVHCNVLKILHFWLQGMWHLYLFVALLENMTERYYCSTFFQATKVFGKKVSICFVHVPSK